MTSSSETKPIVEEETIFCSFSDVEYAWLERTEHTIRMFACPMPSLWRHSPIGCQIEEDRYAYIKRPRRLKVTLEGVDADEIHRGDTRIANYCNAFEYDYLRAELSFWEDKIKRAGNAKVSKAHLLHYAEEKYALCKAKFERRCRSKLTWYERVARWVQNLGKA